MSDKPLIELPYRITNGCCEHYKDYVFLFGYDVMGKSMDGQASILGHPNTIPIPVMYKFCNSGARYFTDSDSECRRIIDRAIDNVLTDAVIIPLRKMGEGCSRLKELAPLTHKHLYERLNAIKYPNIKWRYDW